MKPPHLPLLNLARIFLKLAIDKIRNRTATPAPRCQDLFDLIYPGNFGHEWRSYFNDRFLLEIQIGHAIPP